MEESCGDTVVRKVRVVLQKLEEIGVAEIFAAHGRKQSVPLTPPRTHLADDRNETGAELFGWRAEVHAHVLLAIRATEGQDDVLVVQERSRTGEVEFRFGRRFGVVQGLATHTAEYFLQRRQPLMPAEQRSLNESASQSASGGAAVKRPGHVDPMSKRSWQRGWR